MFCYQCEQTAKGKGCFSIGVCGKRPEVASLQDLLMYITKGIAQYTFRAGKLGFLDVKIGRFIVKSTYSTLTNVNFDVDRLLNLIFQALAVRESSRSLYERNCQEKGLEEEVCTGPAVWVPQSTEVVDLIRVGESISALSSIEPTGLLDLIVSGVKGVAAYFEHAIVLGHEDSALYFSICELLDFTTHENQTVEEMFAQALRVGELNYKVMQVLDRAHTCSFGDPEPSRVKISPVKGKAILVSGHNLKDLEILLKQTEGKGINVYTHGEMLPAHGYPQFKKYSHLVGNYGGAWQNQQKEFSKFPGSILMTTNCIQEPRKEYADRIFTTGLVAWPGTQQIMNKDFSPVIESSFLMPGFKSDEEDKSIMVGFGHQSVFQIMSKVLDAIEIGKLKHIFLIGGCDGAKSSRNYYTELAKKIPDDCIILTLGCGKYRFNKLDFGSIENFPRLLDIGQCSDTYSALKIAEALAKALDCEINDLPLSFILSWYEQKAIAILLTLLHLGIKNIRIGPTLPAFLTKDVVKLLENRFGLKVVSSPDEDLKNALTMHYPSCV